MWYGGSLYVVGAPVHLEADRHRRRRRGRPAGRVVRGQDADRLRQRPARPLPRASTAGFTGAKGRLPSRPTSGPGKSPFVTRAAHIFRCRPDGTGIEPVMTGGMDNPVDVVFTPGGERIFTTTFLVNPGGGQRDGLIHAIYGGIYGKVHDQIFDAVTQVDRPRGDAGPPAHGAGRPVRTHALRVRRVRQGLSGQPVRLLFQPAQGQPARPDAPRRHVHDQGRRLCLQPGPRLPSDRRDRGCRRQPGHRRYRRLVQALLPDLAASQARRAGCDLSRAGAWVLPRSRIRGEPIWRSDARPSRRRQVARTIPRPAVQRRAIELLSSSPADGTT